MKRVAAVLLMGVFSSSYALGGTVVFDAQGPTNLYPDSGEGPTVGTWVVSLSDDPASDPFVAIGALIGVDSLNQTPGPEVDFVLDDAFRGLFTGITVDDPGPGVYGSDILIDGFVLVPFVDAISLPQVAGILTIDATGVKPGEYTIVIDGNSALDDGRSALDPEGPGDRVPLVGSTTFTVLPEPATLSLLGLAALGLLRRRKLA